MRLNNNLRQTYFMIDTIKAIIPSTKISEKAIKTIAESFNKHGLGKLDEDQLNHYYRNTKLVNPDVDDEHVKYQPKNNKND
jgi:hypothetical protein